MYPMIDDCRSRLVPAALYTSPTEYEPDMISVALGLEIYHAVRLRHVALPTADEWARAHAAYDAAILGDEAVPDQAELYEDVLRSTVQDWLGMSLILSYEDHTIVLGEDPDRRRVPLPAAVAEDGRQIAEMLIGGSPVASGLSGVAMAEALRAWLRPCAEDVRGVHREGIASMYGD